MAEDLFIPKLGQTVEEVVLINWLVEDGEKVDFGDPVLEVETDKAIFTVEANAKGYIHFGPFEMGETVPVLTVVASIGKQEEAFSPGDVIPQKKTGVEVERLDIRPEKLQAREEIQTPYSDEGRSKIFASPRAKKLAEREDVDLSQVTPTGGEGIRIVEQDVTDYLQQKPKATPLATGLAKEVGLDLNGIVGTGPKGVVTRGDVESEIKRRLSQSSKISTAADLTLTYPNLKVNERIPLSPIRRRIFQRMSQSVHATSRVTLVTEADATELVSQRESLVKEKSEVWELKIGYNDLIAMILIGVLKKYPYMNARLSKDEQSFEILDPVNLGIAVDTERGLLVPVIKNADELTLDQFGKQYRQVVNKALSGKATVDDLSGGTFTLTNLGYYDIDAFTPVINLPEVAILGVGRIRDQVVPFESGIAIRKILTLSLVFDHRLIDGAPAAKFLQSVKKGIESPTFIH